MRPFGEFNTSDLNENALRSQLDHEGYCLIRNLLPVAVLEELLRDVTKVIGGAGWLIGSNDPLDRRANLKAACGDPDPDFKSTYQEVFNLARFHALPHHPLLKKVMKMVVGDHLVIHPKPIGRLIFPNCERLRVHAHQDYRFMGGDPECFTAWIPLHDCPAEVGPLQVIAGSHKLGVVNHEDQNLHVPEISEDLLQSGNWIGGKVNAGDVLIFHSLTVHAAAPNVSNQLRISLDCRFQDYGRVLNPAVLAFAGDSGKSWENTYSSWECGELKYYWKDLPLRFKPSIDELLQLSMKADNPAHRARYARILSQVS